VLVRSQKQTVGVPEIFFKILDSELQGKCAMYVDDALNAGNKVYEGIAEKNNEEIQVP
jgi:hypothetical protein